MDIGHSFDAWSFVRARAAGYPLVGILAAEVVLASVFQFDPRFGDAHLLTMLIGSAVAVVVDWLVRQSGHPSLVLAPEPRRLRPDLLSDRVAYSTDRPLC
jgi:hypothetical protein